MPILCLLKELIPAVILATLFFCAFTHCYLILGILDFRPWDKAYRRDSELDRIMWNSFDALFTGSFDNSLTDGRVRSTVSYVAVILFTIFFLNIFIGVIGD